jgi:hypothetical protein
LKKKQNISHSSREKAAGLSESKNKQESSSAEEESKALEVKKEQKGSSAGEKNSAKLTLQANDKRISSSSSEESAKLKKEGEDPRSSSNKKKSLSEEEIPPKTERELDSGGFQFESPTNKEEIDVQSADPLTKTIRQTIDASPLFSNTEDALKPNAVALEKPKQEEVVERVKSDENVLDLMWSDDEAEADKKKEMAEKKDGKGRGRRRRGRGVKLDFSKYL